METEGWGVRHAAMIDDIPQFGHGAPWTILILIEAYKWLD